MIEQKPFPRVRAMQREPQRPARDAQRPNYSPTDSLGRHAELVGEFSKGGWFGTIKSKNVEQRGNDVYRTS